MTTYRCLTMLTDYGTGDGFVAACHGVVMRIAPHVTIVDITHDVPRHDIRRGAAVLAQTLPWMPPAVHFAVVDPGVGTTRRAIAVETAQGVLVGPDNGLMSWAWTALGGVVRAVTLDAAAYRLPSVSPTFHGRDVFAPAAAHLAMGLPLRNLGAAVSVDELIALPEPAAWVVDAAIGAEVVSIDSFGNVQLAATATQLAEIGLALGDRLVVEVLGTPHGARLGRTFADVRRSELVLYEDSSGWMALAVNTGSAADLLGVTGHETLLLRALR